MQAYESSPELYPGPDSHPEEVRRRCRAAELFVHDRFKPEAWEVRAYADAAEAFRDYQLYDGKLPHKGGLLDQPHKWKLAMDCMIAAQREGHARAAFDARADKPEG